MEQLKSFVTGKSAANNMALLLAIGAAAYYQYSEQKKEVMEGETENVPKSNNKKYILWGLVAVFMIPVVINALSTEDVTVPDVPVNDVPVSVPDVPVPSSSFEKSVTEAAEILRSRKPNVSARKPVATETDDFRTRVSEAARRLREQISESMSPETEIKETPVPEASELAEKAGDEIRKFLAENS